jgi:hypothetical protein
MADSCMPEGSLPFSQTAYYVLRVKPEMCFALVTCFCFTPPVLAGSWDRGLKQRSDLDNELTTYLVGLVCGNTLRARLHSLVLTSTKRSAGSMIRYSRSSILTLSWTSVFALLTAVDIPRILLPISRRGHKNRVADNRLGADEAMSLDRAALTTGFTVSQVVN